MDDFTDATDAELLRIWQREKDAEAFNALVLRYSALVYNTCLRVLRDPHEAQDVTQECFITLVQKPPRAQRGLGPWLHTTATRRSIDSLRKSNRRTARESQTTEVLPGEHEAEWNEIQSAVDDAVESLPENLRAPVILHFFEGKTHQAVGDELALSRTTVTHRIRNGVEQIRERLQSKGITVRSAPLATALSTQLITKSPESLLHTLGSWALSGVATPPAATAATSTLMLGSGMKVILAATFIAVIGLGGTAVWRNIVSESKEPTPVAANEVTAPTDTETPPVAEEPSPAASNEPTLTVAADTEQEPPVPNITFTGTVLDPEGEPVPGASIYAGENEQMPLHVTRTDAEGRFTLEAQETELRYLVAAEPAAGWAAFTELPDLTEELTITLTPFSSMSGQVTASDTGKPLAGLTVQIVLNDAGERVMLANSYLSSGISWAQGNQIALTSNAHSMLGPNRGVTLGENGRFSFPTRLPHKYQIQLSGDTPYQLVRYQRVVLQPGENRTHNIHLKPGGVVHGRVYDPDGSPLAGVRLKIRDLGMEVRVDTEKETGRDGSYRFVGIPPGDTFTLLAVHDDFAASMKEHVVPSAGLEGPPVDFNLAKGYRLAGRILDTHGAPTYLSRIGIESSDLSADVHADGAFAFPHVTPGKHNFSLAHSMPKNSANLDTSSLLSKLRDFTMPDYDVTDLELVVPFAEEKQTMFIAGRVTNAEGQPVPNAQVFGGTKVIISPGVSTYGTWPMVRTDDNGEYRAGDAVEEGMYSVRVNASGYVQTEVKDVPPNSTGNDITLLRYARTSGQILDAATGEPVTAFRIRARTVPDNVDNDRREWQQMAHVDGAFVLDEIGGPKSTFHIQADGYVDFDSDALSVPAGGHLENLAFRLRRGAQIRGKVVSADTNEPLRGIYVHAFETPENDRRAGLVWSRAISNSLETNLVLGLDGKKRVPAVTDNAGTFRLPNLNPGRPIGVMAHHKGYAPAYAILDSPESAPRPLTLRLTRGGAVELRLDQPPARKTLARLYASTNAPAIPFFQKVETLDENGAARFESLPIDTYTLLVVDDTGTQHAAYFITTVPGQPNHLHVDIDLLGSQFGTVRGLLPEHSRSALYARTVLSDGRDYRLGTTRADSEGFFRLSGLPPGHISIYEHPIRGTPIAEAVVVPGRTMSVEIE